jgi:hypothetical protein
LLPAEAARDIAGSWPGNASSASPTSAASDNGHSPCCCGSNPAGLYPAGPAWYTERHPSRREVRPCSRRSPDSCALVADRRCGSSSSESLSTGRTSGSSARAGPYSRPVSSSRVRLGKAASAATHWPRARGSGSAASPAARTLRTDITARDSTEQHWLGTGLPDKKLCTGCLSVSWLSECVYTYARKAQQQQWQQLMLCTLTTADSNN